ncbi:MAG: sensor domain-containing diguanylate cyclase [Candidatus Omnitrophica bacterium]|jgi:diguanylate cyclase (GGDEF)-like protein|nr:sensor domain-containing diguanylate cyclase [Candidatus Omnitrophota bacterium]
MRKKFPLKITADISLFFLFFIFLPVFVTVYLSRNAIKYLSVFFLSNILIAYILVRGHLNKKHRLRLQIQSLEEKINILTDENTQELRNKASLKEKIRRYSSLKNIIESINQDLKLDSIAGNLSSVAFSLVANNQGACIIYLVDQQTQRLALFKTEKEDKRLIVKAKEGDIFDAWVLRHISPLLIEDTRKDFRFDLESLRLSDTRPVASLIGAPLITDHRFLGILRLDSPRPSFYSQDDLRLLVTICDLGAIALENGELFQKTEDLAIHDGLTQLFTKGYFLERLKEECKRSFRQEKSLALLMLDIDHFKNYNDEFGHTAGDIVLKTLSSLVSETLEGMNSVIGRFGGEEFCIILPHNDKKKAHTIAKELLLKIEKTKITLRRKETNITVSIGVAAIPADAASDDELLLKADRAMYEAKHKGRNRVCDA